MGMAWWRHLWPSRKGQRLTLTIWKPFIEGYLPFKRVGILPRLWGFLPTSVKELPFYSLNLLCKSICTLIYLAYQSTSSYSPQHHFILYFRIRCYHILSKWKGKCSRSTVESRIMGDPIRSSEQRKWYKMQPPPTEQLTTQLHAVTSSKLQLRIRESNIIDAKQLNFSICGPSDQRKRLFWYRISSWSSISTLCMFPSFIDYICS